MDAARQRLQREGREFVTVLLGTSSYDSEPSTAPTADTGEVWLLEDDALGRGIRRPKDRSPRTVTADELVAALMTAERVIQFP